jgi:hypothetical protein
MSTDVVGGLPRVLDRALAGADACPFHSYEESLVHFARALYALRLDGGRCSEPGTPAGCGLHDPNGLYREPEARTFTYVGEEVVMEEALPNSFAVDFIEVHLDPVTDGRSLTLELWGGPGAVAAFSVQVWRLSQPGPDAQPRAVAPPDVLSSVRGDRRLSYTIPVVDTSHVDRLAVIVTRVDDNESTDTAGGYTILLRPTTPEAREPVANWATRV